MANRFSKKPKLVVSDAAKSDEELEKIAAGATVDNMVSRQQEKKPAGAEKQKRLPVMMPESMHEDLKAHCKTTVPKLSMSQFAVVAIMEKMQRDKRKGTK